MAMLTLVPSAMGGSETYARELTRQLGASTRVSVTAHVARGARGFSVGVPETVAHSVGGGDSSRDRVKTILETTFRRRSLLVAMRPFDVIHYPFTVPLPRPPRDTAAVVTLHDLQHLDLPGLFSPAERLYRRHLYEAAARSADRVITISQFVRESIVRHLEIDRDRITVAHLGVDPSAFTPHLGDRDPFVLYPARGWPHKNHPRLIEAVRLLREDMPGLRLVLTGGGLEALGAQPEWVEVLGQVPFERLTELYRRAACLAFPSMYEGFGLPPLEAMASGCPVAASSAGALPEVCGDAAVLFDPRDAHAMAASIGAAIADSSSLQTRGLARVKSFTWSSCASAHEDAFIAAAGLAP